MVFLIFFVLFEIDLLLKFFLIWSFCCLSILDTPLMMRKQYMAYLE